MAKAKEYCYYIVTISTVDYQPLVSYENQARASPLFIIKQTALFDKSLTFIHGSFVICAFYIFCLFIASHR